MDDEITVETVDDLRRTILAKVRTAQDIQTLNGLSAEDFGADGDLLNSSYRVVVGNIQNGLPPPSVGLVVSRSEEAASGEPGGGVEGARHTGAGRIRP